MPTYEYQCKSCEHRFEVWQKMTDEALTTCPECNGSIRRIFFPAGIVFKGSGFYKTDHGNGAVISESDGKEHKDDAAKKEPKDGATKKEQASEAKPAASSEKAATASGDKAAAAAAD